MGSRSQKCEFPYDDDPSSLLPRFEMANLAWRVPRVTGVVRKDGERASVFETS